MSNPKLVIAQVSDGKFAAASTGAPYFCTIGDSAEEVRARAAAAMEFYRSVKSRRAPIAPRVTQVEHLTPYETEAWMADAVMAPA